MKYVEYDFPGEIDGGKLEVAYRQFQQGQIEKDARIAESALKAGVKSLQEAGIPHFFIDDKLSGYKGRSPDEACKGMRHYTEKVAKRAGYTLRS